MSGRFEIAIADLAPGDVLVADGGFTCLDEGAEVKVESLTGTTEFRHLYVTCCLGEHFLEGQRRSGNVITGFRRRDAKVIAFPGRAA